MQEMQDARMRRITADRAAAALQPSHDGASLADTAEADTSPASPADQVC